MSDASESVPQSSSGRPSSDRSARDTNTGALSERDTLPPERPVEPREALRKASSSRQTGSIPAEFGRYRILKLLGQGGMGSVYLAHDTELNRKVALKIPKFRESESNETVERFYREARSSATLRSAHICPVYDVGEIDGVRYISMAYIEGRQLSDYVASGRHLLARQIALLVRKLAMALQEAHDRGVVHRDLKPSNIMIDAKHEPIIMDFGLARQMDQKEDERLTQEGAIIGSPAYMSPEQVEGRWAKIGPACDIYSLGVVLYELLAGRTPFTGSIASVIGQIVSKAPKKPSAWRPEVDSRLEAICLKMLAKRIGNRFASMSEVVQALTDYLKSLSGSGDQGASATVGPDVSGETSKQKRHKVTAQDVADLLELSQEFMERHDYAQVIQLMESIPPRRRTNAVLELLDKATDLQDEVTWLISDLKDAVLKHEYEGLLPNVKRLLELKPRHAKAQKVYEQLTGKLFGGGRRPKRMRGFAARSGSRRTSGDSWLSTSIATMIMVGVVAFGLMTWGITIYLRSDNQTIMLEIDDLVRADDVSVSIDGEGIDVEGIGKTITLKRGDHELEIRRGDVVAKTEEFRVVRGEKTVLRISLVDKKGASENTVSPVSGEGQVGEPELVDVHRIWDQAPFNAFTDLIRFRGQWYCVFREGQAYVSKDGSLRVLASSDGHTWRSTATMASPTADLRDPKLSVTPDGRLMLMVVAALHQPAAAHHQSMVWFSADGENWTITESVGERDVLLWDVTWHDGVGYCMGYTRGPGWFVSLYRTLDGKTFVLVADNLYEEELPNEASLTFGKDDTCFCLLRREGGGGAPCVLGTARPPYADWSWKVLDARIGGPNLILLSNDRLLTAVRLYDEGTRTSLCWIDAEKGHLQECLKLPSGGHTGYAGMVWHDGMLWVSYYASHEDKTSIYLARVRFDSTPAEHEGVELAFVSLFDGKTLNGWQGATAEYRVEGGALVSTGDNRGTILTTKQYSNFVLRFEYQLEAGANNGVLIRAPLETEQSRAGMEIQILDESAPRYANLEPRKCNGAIFNVAPATRGHLKPVGEWNSQEILCRGHQVRVTLNGIVILDVDLDQLPSDARERCPGIERDTGYVGFMGYRSRVAFRNIRIKDLSRQSEQAADTGFTPLFDGRTLNGWEGDPNFWRVENGTIVGQAPARVHTFLSTDESYKDFVLKAKFKLIFGNSGIQVRSRQLAGYKMSGPQVDILTDVRFLGRLTYLEGDKGTTMTPAEGQTAAQAYRPNDWNAYVITCQGSRITVNLNGHETQNFVDRSGQVPHSGMIGFQLFSPVQPSSVSFKNIMIEELR